MHDDDEREERESGISKLGKALSEGTKAAVGTDPSSWFRALFVQTGAVGVICWAFYTDRGRVWDLLDANREELRAVETRAADRAAKQWEEVRRLREAVQEMATELRALRGE